MSPTEPHPSALLAALLIAFASLVYSAATGRPVGGKRSGAVTFYLGHVSWK